MTKFLPFVVFLLCARVAVGHNNGPTLYLRELTIYQTHETSLPFMSNSPEVYLSCEDGADSIDLGHVDKTRRLYVFEMGQRPTTSLADNGCVTCRLKEEDPVISDQVFGTWEMCESDFFETGSNTVEVPGQFTALWDCPSCKLPDENLGILPEAEPPLDDLDEKAEAPESSPADGVPLREEAQSGVYYDPNEEEEIQETTVTLQSENNEEIDEAVDERKSTDGGLSIGGVLGIVFSLFFVGIIVGVCVVMRYPAVFAKIKNMNRKTVLGKFDSKIALTKFKSSSSMT